MLARGRKFRLCSLRSVKEGEIEMKETNVTFLKAVQRSFFMVLFLILFLSSNSLAGTFMFEPATHQITCYDGSGNVITCPPGDNPIAQGGSCYDKAGNVITCPPGRNYPKAQVGSYSSDPLPFTDNNSGLNVTFEPATHQITCYDGSGNLITCPPGGNPFVKGDSCYDVSGNLITCPPGGNVMKGRQVKVKNR